MPGATIRIPARFNGPPESANGGYACGLVAGALGSGAAEVTLRSPPPLERDLKARVDATGVVSVLDGSTLVAEARSATVDLELPEPPSVESADKAARAGRERWSAEHPFPGCVVCGPARAPGDGLRLFPGALGGGLFACPWTPDESVAEESGAVARECVWAALDCPTSAPVANYGAGPPLVLGRQAARLDAPVKAGEPHVLVSWELDRDGRKRSSAGALFDSRGRCLARSRAVWIELAVS